MKWTYFALVPAMSMKEDESRLQTMGAQGWELVCTAHNGTYILKRAIEPAPTLTTINNETGDPIDPPKKRK